MDNILGNGVGRGCLTTKEDSQRTGRNVASLDVQILVDDIKNIHLLTFVLMHTLDLNIKDRLRVHFNTLILSNVTLQLPLVVLLDFFQTVLEFLAVLEVQELLQLRSIVVIAMTNQLIQIVGQARVGVHEPATEGNTVGLVIEFFWVKVIEGLQLRRFQNVCVEGRNTVDGISVVNIHVSHVHTAVLINDIDRRVVFHFFCTTVQFLDKWYQMRYNTIQEIKWPFFQSLCQDGVVGVGRHLLNDLNSLIKVNTTKFQKTNQLWNHQRWVGIIDLNHCVVWQIMEI